MLANIPSPVQMTQELVRRPSTQDHGEQACADYAAELLGQAGFSLRAFDLAPGRPSLVAVLAGSQPGPALCFTGHFDTVDLGQATWSFDPFCGRVEGGRLLGRGSTDMKGGVGAMLHAALRLAQGPKPRRDLVLVLTADEEHGLKGAFQLVGTPGALPAIGALVVGEPTMNQPHLGHKGGLWFTAEFSGRAAHASMPHLGDNAIHKAAAAVTALTRHQFGLNHPVLGRPTLNVGKIQGGTSINIVADFCRLELDVRLPPGVEPQAMLAELLQVMGGQATASAVKQIPPLWTEPTDPWIAAALPLIAACRGRAEEPGGSPYVTDAAALTPALGCPTLLLGPGDLDQAHQVDESCDVARIEEAAEIYFRLAQAWGLE